MSGPVRHREVAFIPICIPKDSRIRPWFDLMSLRPQKRLAIDALTENYTDWETLKKEGWRIVRVEVLS